MPITASIVVGNLATTEKYFDHFEIECWNSGRSTKILGPFSAPGEWNSSTGQFEQRGLVYFRGLTKGTVYSFRSRVWPKGGGPASTWTSWADETAGDTTAPATTYGATVDSVHKGLIIKLNPSGSPSDHDRFELFSSLSSATPAASTIPTQVDHTDAGNFFVGQFAGTPVPVHSWARDIDTSGNPQTWVSCSI